jgi:hypothetical protein
MICCISQISRFGCQLRTLPHSRYKPTCSAVYLQAILRQHSRVSINTRDNPARRVVGYLYFTFLAKMSQFLHTCVGKWFNPLALHRLCMSREIGRSNRPAGISFCRTRVQGDVCGKGRGCVCPNLLFAVGGCWPSTKATVALTWADGGSVECVSKLAYRST